MNQHYRAIIVPAGFLSVALAASFLGGCAQTAAPEPNIIERAQAGRGLCLAQTGGSRSKRPFHYRYTWVSRGMRQDRPIKFSMQSPDFVNEFQTQGLAPGIA
jgi:hypothetical protein